MIGLLIWLLVFLVVIYVVKLVVDALTLPDNVKKIVFLILGLIGLLILISQLGLLGPGYVSYGPGPGWH